MRPITKEKIGWGMIGTGRIAHEFSDSLELVEDGEVVAVGSRNMETAERFAAEYGGTPYGSYEEMMQDPNVDIVYVATPHMVHEENVIMAAKYGKHILCEKPFTINRPSAERMFAAAKEADVFIMEGLWTRFFPVWQEAKKIIQSGELGQLVSIDAACCWGARRRMTNGNLMDGNFPRGDRRMELDLCGGALLDAGIYSLAAASVVMGGLTKIPEKIYSLMRFEPSGVDSDTDIMLELDGGVTAHLVCSLHRRNNEVNIYFEEGTIHIPNCRNPQEIEVTRRVHQKGIPLFHAGSETVTRRLPYRTTGFQFEAEVVHNCLRQGLTTCPDVPPEETQTLIGICDIVRAAHGLKYPYE